MAIVEIVDLSAGARVRILSQRASTSDPNKANWTFTKRTASSWFTYIQGNSTVVPPARLLSTVNASFFIDTDNSHSTSPLSYPEVKARSVRNYGWVLDHHSDLGWDVPKRALKFSDPTGAQTASIVSFPNAYTSADPSFTFGCSGDENCSTYDGLVSKQPLYGDCSTCSNHRTFVGVNGSKVYILATTGLYTLTEAQKILQLFAPITSIQLDGGGSTQMYTAGDSQATFPSIVNRTVPDVLAVYHA